MRFGFASEEDDGNLVLNDSHRTKSIKNIRYLVFVHPSNLEQLRKHTLKKNVFFYFLNIKKIKMEYTAHFGFEEEDNDNSQEESKNVLFSFILCFDSSL